MISSQFCKIFKNVFFFEHLRWLLDSQRQLCKGIFKLATIYFISTFSWHFCAYFWQVQAFLLHLDGPVVEKIWWFWFFTWSHNWSVTWLCGWGPLILNHHPTRVVVHRPCETGDNVVCSISSSSNYNSNSNSNAEVPKPRFTNGLIKVLL